MLLPYLLNVALAQDPAPVEDKVVGPLVADQEVLVEGKPQVRFRLTGKYWLIRDDALRTAVSNAKIIPTLDTALDQCREKALECGTQATEAWSIMRRQFEADDAAMDACTVGRAQDQADLTVVRAYLDRVKRSRTTAWLFLGGVLAAGVVGLATGLGVAH